MGGLDAGTVYLTAHGRKPMALALSALFADASFEGPPVDKRVVRCHPRPCSTSFHQTSSSALVGGRSTSPR